MTLFQKSIATLTLLFTVNMLNAQCKGFTKKRCLPELAPYLSNGQMIAAKFIPGEKATVEINFNKGISYRLIVCGDPYLENLNYQLSDVNGTVYNSDTLTKEFSSVDLSVRQSGPLNLSLDVPMKKTTNDIVRNGCVTILVGFKDQ